MVAKLSGVGRVFMAGLQAGVVLQRTVAVPEAVQQAHETKRGGGGAKRKPCPPKRAHAWPYKSQNGGFSYRRGLGAGVLFFPGHSSLLPPSLNAVAHSAGRA